jgi:Protein of unknown function (DUF2865)
MVATAMTKLLRRCGAAVLIVWTAPAVAQPGFPPPQNSPRNPTCLRLESQLAVIDRGGASFDPARAEQIKRYEDAAAKQQGELDRLSEQSRRMGCQGAGFFSLFSGQPQQCGPLNNQVQQTRANLDRYLTEIQRLQGNSGEREAQRRGILVALGQNDCGPQYRQYAHGGGVGGFFETLFGGNSGGSADAPPAGTYRTLCVRTCDGYYFPISYSTVPTKFAEDERLCQRLCPATEAVLFSHRNPGEDVARAVSSGGRVYSDLPAAFSYRKQYNPACNCRSPGQSWAEALRPVDDQTVERGDIVVTEERARQLSQPRVDAQGKPVSIEPNPARPGAAKPATATAPPLAPAATVKPPAAPVEEAAIEEDRSKRKVRGVGPAFYPAR